MSDLSKITTEKLNDDLMETELDIMICERALELGISSHEGIDVQGRLEENNRVRKIILAELAKRGLPGGNGK